MENYKNKNITVVGLGKSGLAAAEFLENLGARVKVTEAKGDVETKTGIQKLRKKNIEFEFGRHRRDFIKGSDLIVASPGVSSGAPPLLWAKKAGIPVIGELELASCFVPCPIIAVTGTNGKTTTATLLGEILKKKHKVEVAGNIGRPLSALVPNLTGEHLLVLEVSSFQLERIKDFHPKISIILNVTPDHLDRYSDFDDYLLAKKRIFLNQGPGDYAIFPADTPYTESLVKEVKCNHMFFGAQPGLRPGVFCQDSAIYFNLNGRREKILDERNIRLKGAHNRENIMAALAAACILKEDLKTVAEVIKNFSGLEHRMEVVSQIQGVRFVNDSKSTNADSLLKALQSFPRIILIAGGRDKGADFTPLRNEIEERVSEIILLGEAKEKLKDAWRNTRPIHPVENLEEAVALARKLAKRGEVILLSPGCSSFDMFKNFEERGRAFKEIIHKLKSKIKYQSPK